MLTLVLTLTTLTATAALTAFAAIRILRKRSARCPHGVSLALPCGSCREEASERSRKEFEELTGISLDGHGTILASVNCGECCEELLLAQGCSAVTLVCRNGHVVSGPSLRQPGGQRSSPAGDAPADGRGWKQERPPQDTPIPSGP
jgi:hypothetical protein